jgi:acyl carrier protein
MNRADIVTDIQELVANVGQLRMESVNENSPVFGQNALLDSIDAADVWAGIYERFGVPIRYDEPDFEGRVISVGAIADFVFAKRHR